MSTQTSEVVSKIQGARSEDKLPRLRVRRMRHIQGM